MKVKKHWILVAIVLTLSVVVQRNAILVADISDTPLEEMLEIQRATLAGIPGVSLMIFGPSKDLEEHGLTNIQLKTDVELKLRQAGIKILSREERDKTPGSPLLVVYVLGQKLSHAGGFMIGVSAEVKQSVLLERNPAISCYVPTWQTFETTGFFQSDNLHKVRQVVKDHVDQFINDYLAANPKEPPKEQNEKKPED